MWAIGFAQAGDFARVLPQLFDHVMKPKRAFCQSLINEKANLIIKVEAKASRSKVASNVRLWAGPVRGGLLVDFERPELKPTSNAVVPPPAELTK